MCMAITDPRKARSKLGINQSKFWSRVGVTQSGGSRYESGRSIPDPVKILLTVAYGTEKQSADAIKALRTRPTSAAA